MHSVARQKLSRHMWRLPLWTCDLQISLYSILLHLKLNKNATVSLGKRQNATQLECTRLYRTCIMALIPSSESSCPRSVVYSISEEMPVRWHANDSRQPILSAAYSILITIEHHYSILWKCLYGLPIVYGRPYCNDAKEGVGAITPPKLNRWWWNSATTKYFKGNVVYKNLGAIGSGAAEGRRKTSLRDPKKLFCPHNNARSHPLPVGRFSRNFR